MDISFVGSCAGTHAATSAQTVNFSNLRDESNAVPTLLEGDYVLVAVENASTVDRTQAQLTPSGYTALHTDNYQNDSNDSNLLVSGKFMGASPDASVAIPASNATTAGVAYAIYVWRGVDPTTPMDVAPVVTGGTNTGVANAASITPASTGAVIMAIGGAAVAAGAVFTNPAGMSTKTNFFRSATITTTTNDANIGVAVYDQWTSGAYDPAVFGGSTSTNTGSWSAVTIALRPSLAGNRVSNGNFSNGLVGWQTDGGTRAVTAGVLRLTASGGLNANSYQYVPTVAGEQYDWSIDCVAKSAGTTFSVSFNNATGQTSIYNPATGTYNGRLTATGKSVTLILNAGTTTAAEWAEFDNISLTLVPPARYKGSQTRANRYLGARADAQLDIGPTAMGWA